MPKNDLTEMFGEPISVYTEDQAIEDGVLIHPYPKNWPWLLITQAIHDDCSNGNNGNNGRTYDKCLIPLLHDCIMAAQAAQKNSTKPPLILENTICGTIWIEPNSKGGMTVMKPEER